LLDAGQDAERGPDVLHDPLRRLAVAEVREAAELLADDARLLGHALADAISARGVPLAGHSASAGLHGPPDFGLLRPIVLAHLVPMSGEDAGPAAVGA